MRRSFWWSACVLLILAVIITSWRTATAHKPVSTASAARLSAKKITVATAFVTYVNDIYKTADLATSGLDYSVFQKALTGYYNLKNDNKLAQSSSVITIVDFDKPSASKRMWIVDLLKRQLVLNTWVAHGQGSGDLYASQFSNNADSHESSLGFYVTDDIYFGKHGRSLHLDGMDKGFNSNARSRAIVLHSADYVCQNTINQLGRLGRSFGCPAVSPEVCTQIIDLIKGKNMLYIHANNNAYNSKYLNENFMANFALPSHDSVPQLSKAIM